MRILLIILAIIGSVYVVYRGYPIVKYYYLKYTADTMGLHTQVPDAKAQMLDGTTWSTKKNLGKEMIVIFWSSYCPPCIKEIPHIVEVYNQYKDDKNIEIVSYSLDLSLDKDALKKYVVDKNITYPVLVDIGTTTNDENFAKKFEVFGAPSIWFIDKKGTILASNRRSIQEVLPFIKR